MELDDLTKEELIWLLRRHCFSLTERDIARARIERLQRQSLAMREESLTLSSKALQDKTLAGRKVFEEASKLFDRGMRLDDQASALHDQYWGRNE
ncbi:MAG: hypothetical protein IAE79_17570 [Anaerolinea sp.]|nr:hypothetical protein [Anaerolinea sp.]